MEVEKKFKNKNKKLIANLPEFCMSAKVLVAVEKEAE